MKILDIVRTALLGALVLLGSIGVIGIFSINGHLKSIESSANIAAVASLNVSKAPIMELDLIRKKSRDGSETTWSLPVGSWSWSGN
jgi:hypothetical protein